MPIFISSPWSSQLNPRNTDAPVAKNWIIGSPNAGICNLREEIDYHQKLVHFFEGVDDVVNTVVSSSAQRRRHPVDHEPAPPAGSPSARYRKYFPRPLLLRTQP